MSFEYVAGFIDGEGYIGILTAGKYTYCKLDVTNTNEEIIKWLSETYGGTAHRVKRKTITLPNAKPSWLWNLQGKGLLPFLVGIQPYARVKKKHIDLAIKFLETKSSSCRIEMAKLNRRGLGKLNLADAPAKAVHPTPNIHATEVYLCAWCKSKGYHICPHSRVLQLYNPAIHKAGDRVLMQKGKRLVEAIVPELDADGRPIPP